MSKKTVVSPEHHWLLPQNQEREKLDSIWLKIIFITFYNVINYSKLNEESKNRLDLSLLQMIFIEDKSQNKTKFAS